VDSSHLITKVYFPRLIIPLSGVIAGLVDFAVSSLVLLALLVIYRIPPTQAVILLPLFLLMAMGTALGFGLWFSALNVRYRDIRQLVPFVVQIWMYVTPVIYSASVIPERLRPLLALNPMTGVVEGFRWALLGNVMTDTQAPGGLFAVSVLIMTVVLISGLFYFRSTEQTFADII
jgi:lipopolysaccharide transport system permease protein